jgi:ubiquinone/menaquinone biosynthesis C-methylase UbiE
MSGLENYTWPRTHLTIAVTDERHQQQQQHWQNIFNTKAHDKVSWFRTDAGVSWQMISNTVNNNQTAISIMDIGAGSNPVLVKQCLENLPQANIFVLDISQIALDRMKESLTGKDEERVKYIVGNVCEGDVFSAVENTLDVVHDRAVFHFLTDAVDRELYMKNVHRALKKGGHLIIGTFALPDGPLQCSGINIVRYDEKSLQKQMEKYFVFVDSTHEMHKTPFNSIQHFIFCHFVKKD